MVTILNEGYFANLKKEFRNSSTDFYKENDDIRKQTISEFINSVKSDYPNAKIAIVHQSLWKMRGGERMVKMVADALGNIDIYTLFGDPKVVKSDFSAHKIHFSWLRYIPFIKYLYRYSIPLWPFIFPYLKLDDYDLVISFSSSFAKSIRTLGKHIAIIFTPTRYLWDLSEIYYKAAYWMRRIPMFLFYTPLRIFDVNSAQSPDKMYAISDYVARRINKYYGRSIDGIVYPMIEVPKSVWEGRLHNQRENFYLSISPFEENKGGNKVFEVAVKFNLDLKVIGGGNLLDKYLKKYGHYPNIEFLGYVNDATKWRYLSRAKGLLMLGIEDWGTVQLESNSAGCPVIAYAKGGVLENIRNGVGGCLVDGLDETSLSHAFSELGSKKWSHMDMKDSVEKFVKVV